MFKLRSILAALPLLAALSLGAAATAPALAADPVVAPAAAVDSQLSASRVEMVGNAEQLKPADKASPGDVIEYRARYVNKSAAAVNSLAATVPVPAGSTYIAGSARPANAQASLNGTTFAPIPLTRTVKGADGKERQEAVPLTEYRALRWMVGQIGAGKDVTVSLRVAVNKEAAPAK